MSAPRILIIDDDTELCAMLGEFLSGEGMSVTAAHDGESGRERLAVDAYDAVVPDVMLPGASGFDVLRAIRRESERLDALVGEILAYARLQQNESLHIDDFDLADLVGDIAADARLEGRPRGIEVDAALPDALPFRGDENLLHRAIGKRRPGPRVKRSAPRSSAFSRRNSSPSWRP